MEPSFLENGNPPKFSYLLIFGSIFYSKLNRIVFAPVPIVNTQIQFSVCGLFLARFDQE
jgi:hypothetical protein